MALSESHAGPVAFVQNKSADPKLAGGRSADLRVVGARARGAQSPQLPLPSRARHASDL